MNTSPFRSILITGASSGIGYALAKELAGPNVALTLTGRDAVRLEEIKGALSETGADVIIDRINVTDTKAMELLISKADARKPLDLVIANAGVSGGSDPEISDEDQALNIMTTNVLGVMNTALPAKRLMSARGQGHIAIVSSLAGFRGLPTAPTYSASKVAVRAWGEALRPGLAEDGIGLTLIYPGFVESRITDKNNFPMPFLMSAEKSAQIIVKGLSKSKNSIFFPWQMVAIMRCLALLPGPIFNKVLAKGPKKI